MIQSVILKTAVTLTSKTNAEALPNWSLDLLASGSPLVAARAFRPSAAKASILKWKIQLQSLAKEGA
jgi:hypothetical protein